MAGNVYENVKRRFEALAAASGGNLIERRPLYQEERDQAGRRLSATAAGHRQLRDDQNKSLFPLDEGATRPQGVASTAIADWSPAQLEDHFLARLLQASQISISHLGHAPGWTVRTPYDVVRSEGNGILNDTLNTGECLTIPTDDGLSLAGVGFRVTPSQEQDADIYPLGGYEFNMFCLGGSPTVRSQGGLSAAVYLDGEPSPLAERSAVVWNVVGVPQFFGQQGSGQISLAATPPGPDSLGTVPLSPLSIPLHIGSSYVVWYWCWQQSNAVSRDGFFASLTMTLEGARVYTFPPTRGPA